MPTKKELQILQALPLELKIMKSLERIRDWVKYFGEENVYVSFSGGKDSTVLLHLVRSIYPNIKAVYIDTGLEYPEIKMFVKKFNNILILYPEMNFRKVLEKCGYPIISKEVSLLIEYARKGSKWALYKLEGKNRKGENDSRKSAFKKYSNLLSLPFNISDKCCNLMKKKPAKNFEHKFTMTPIIGTIAKESSIRENAWLKNGCNAFEADRPISTPIAFWTEQDILQYINQNHIKIASVYGEIIPESIIAIDDSLLKLKCSGCDRTGCMFCLFGMHLEKGETRMQRLHKTHPKIYDYVLGGGEFNDKGLWIPNDKGLGFKFVMDEVNRVMGQNLYRY